MPAIDVRYLQESTMTSNFEQFKDKMLATNYPTWRRIASTLALAVASIGVVVCFIYLYITNSGFHCYKGFLILSIIWLTSELVAISYLFFWSNIPKFARDAIKMNIAFANIWFGLFIFSIKACVK